VLEMACEALKAIEAAGFPELTVAVNVSPLQLVQKGFADEIIATVARHGIAPHRMEIEITESAAMSDQQADGNILRGLKKAGFPIAIDDFGTGYSSLSYLHTLSASTLKIDQRFVHEIGVIPDEQNITDMIIGLGKRMKLDVLAEGVETEAQAQWLERHGCQRAQGYFFARPEPLAAFLARLQTQPR
jgi:EAL domain-containing protein (putative c-di-GMP-specific phosphodiesterase class I)